MVQRLKKGVQESQAAFEKSVLAKGLAFARKRTAMEFSQADHTHWVRQLHSAYRADLQEKSESLQKLRYNVRSLSDVLSVWDSEPQQVKGIFAQIFT